MKKKSNTTSFYVLVARDGRYERVAIVESTGLAHIVGMKLAEVYTEGNLYSTPGAGKKFLPMSIDVTNKAPRRVTGEKS